MLGTPQNSCYFSGCAKFPNLMCDCSDQITYSCAKHIGKHSTLTKVTHRISTVDVADLKGPQKEKSLKKIDKILSDIESIRVSSLVAYSEVVNSLNVCIKNFLDRLRTFEISMAKVKQLIQTDQEINNDFIKDLMNTKGVRLNINNTWILEKISEILSLEIDSKDKFMLHASENDQKMYLIDLKNFKKIIFPNLSNTFYFSAACRINENEYFIAGAYEYSEYTYQGYYRNQSINQNNYSHASIINIKTKTETVLDGDFLRYNHSCVFKDNQIFIFGGQWNRYDINTAMKFEIKAKKWSNLPNMPFESHTCATLIDDSIVIAGSNLNCALVFDKNTYSENLKLSNIYYMACNKWLIGGNSLYECKNLKNIVWESYKINISVTFCSINATFRNGKYIYFSKSDQELWRIDLNAKSAEAINFT